MRSKSLILGHFRNVPIRLHPSLLLLLPLVALGTANLDLGLLFQKLGIPAHHLSLPPLAHGMAMAILLFVSVLLHEMGHAAAALKFQLPVGSITLLIFGGATEIDQEDATPKQALVTALAGPAVNLMITVFTLVLVKWLPTTMPDAKLMLLILGVMNLFLLVFNLIPAFPLDGGRALRALLQLQMSSMRASYWTAQTGRLTALLLGCFGLYIGDLILVMLSVLLYFGAQSERTQTTIRSALEGLVAEHAMSTRVISVSPYLSITAVARDMLMGDARAAIVESAGHIHGVVLPEDLRGMSQDTVAVLMDGAPLIAQANMPLNEVSRKLTWTGKPAIVIGDDGGVVGVVTNAEIIRAARLKILAEQSIESGSETDEGSD